MDHIPGRPARSGVLLVAQELGQGGSERQLAATAMGLMGVTSLSQLNPSWVRAAQPTGPAGVTSAYPWLEEQKK